MLDQLKATHQTVSLPAVTRSSELVTTGLTASFFTRASTRDDGSLAFTWCGVAAHRETPSCPTSPVVNLALRAPSQQGRRGGQSGKFATEAIGLHCFGRSFGMPINTHQLITPTAMKQLNFELKNLCLSNRDGAHATQANRHEMLQQIAGELEGLGFRHMQASSLKGKHVDALVKSWQERDLSPGRMKNLMAALRWWADKAGAKGAVAASNDAYGIERRIYVTNTPKAATAPETAKESISDPYVRASVELQAAFGLRREEAIKFSPSYADKGSHIVLKGSWTKGGRPRLVPIRTEAQRAALARAHEVAGKGSMIPPDLRYVDQLRRYEGQVAAAGLSKLHGLRHAYAQQRYLELTGRLAPAAGGKVSAALTAEEKQADLLARLQISQELGHEREQITAVYLGR